ncbi:hypothetical protein GCM10027047_32050 [Rhodococcus aerolatus]
MSQPHDPSESGRDADRGGSHAAGSGDGGFRDVGSQQGGYEQGGYGQGGYQQSGQGSYPQQGGYQQGSYPQQGGDPWGGQPPASPRNGLGVAALVLGILAILTSFTVIGGVLLGLLAVVLGFVGRGRAKKGQATNGGVALAGIITGLVGLVLGILLVVVGVSLFNSSGGSDFISCVNDAGGDQAKVQQCTDEFSSQLGVPTT